MNELLPIVLAFRLTLGPAPQQPDRWLAEDKLKHFFMSATVTSMAFGTARLVGLENGAALGTAAGAAAAAGIWKEMRDRRRGEPFSGKDLVWDGLGIGAGLALAAQAR